jgi:hypothetical protein
MAYGDHILDRVSRAFFRSGSRCSEIKLPHAVPERSGDAGTASSTIGSVCRHQPGRRGSAASGRGEHRQNSDGGPGTTLRPGSPYRGGARG